MYKSKIFLIGESEEKLIALVESGYVTENVLQQLLAKYPDLLPGDQMNPENPRRWLLVGREVGVPGDVGETGRWSLDHLFLDQDGIPTFVECKRTEDTRTRREVVAQMLDYAANGTEYWKMDQLRQSATETCQRRKKSLDEEIMGLLERDQDPAAVEEYWQQVEANLRHHRIRLIFVADAIPKELRRLVAFLNEEMANVEVLAVEVKQFQKEDQQAQKALVPRVVGFTESVRKPTPTLQKRVTREEFLERCPAETRPFFEQMLDKAEEQGHEVYMGTTGFSVRAHTPRAGGLATFAYAYPPNLFQFYFHKDWVVGKERSQALRKRLLEFGIFKESGEYTLSARLTEQNLEQAYKAYELILSQIDDHIQVQREQQQKQGGEQ